MDIWNLFIENFHLKVNLTLHPVSKQAGHGKWYNCIQLRIAEQYYNQNDDVLPYEFNVRFNRGKYKYVDGYTV